MKYFAATAFAAAATAGLAHSGVINPAVLDRMDAMSTIADEMKALAGMARGEVAFDAETVAQRMETIAAVAGEVPVLFEAAEMDPASEAAPTIWTSYPEFTRRAVETVEAADAGAGAETPTELKDALGALAQTCRACHESFKI
ncbi:MAG: cytochrome c [Maritimibacter sp.]|nr:cytochrome c [Maritimibacter sp.]